MLLGILCLLCPFSVSLINLYFSLQINVYVIYRREILYMYCMCVFEYVKYIVYMLYILNTGVYLSIEIRYTVLPSF